MWGALEFHPQYIERRVRIANRHTRAASGFLFNLGSPGSCPNVPQARLPEVPECQTLGAAGGDAPTEVEREPSHTTQPSQRLHIITLKYTIGSWVSERPPHFTLQRHRSPGTPKAQVLPTGLWYISCGWMMYYFLQG